ncbi:MAG: hypothetical protein RLZZ200_2930 [Pseudomonadota bacterium]|jgi:uncharacterized protein YigA (DUF484 family)
MTTPSPAAGEDFAAADAPVIEHLRANPDFFVRNDSLLSTLRLPHARGGGSVSLVERQVEMLREKNHTLESKLAELVVVARANEQLVVKFHDMTRRLLGASDRQDAVMRLEQSLREDFDLVHAKLVLFGKGAVGITPNRFVSCMDAKDAALGGFDSLFAGGKPRCGQVRDSQRDYLFGPEGAVVSSVALVPIGTPVACGLLALGSPDRNRFNPGISTDFLSRLADLVGDALTRG